METFSICLGLVSLTDFGLKSMTNGISISFSFTTVNFCTPEIPWTTKIPISISSLENVILGSTTFNVVLKVFWTPQRGWIVTSAS